MYETYEAGLADRPDTVLICTPPGLHVPQAMQAIQAGCHVLSEKPLSDSTDGIDELAALAAAERKKVMVALCFRYHDGLLKARASLDAGRIGRLVSIRALMGEHLPDVRPDYRTLFSAQHGGAFDLMHEIDLALWYAGLAGAARSTALSGSYSDIGIAAPDVAEILIGFEDRCLASVHLDFFQRPRRRQIELIGTGGVIMVEFAGWDRCTVSIYEAAKARGSTRNWSPTATTCSARKTGSSSRRWPTISRSAARSPRHASRSKSCWRARSDPELKEPFGGVMQLLSGRGKSLSIPGTRGRNSTGTTRPVPKPSLPRCPA